ncbi:hypothetical protein DFQ28_011613, partial [Apophysomyces sp. BC1034]
NECCDNLLETSGPPVPLPTLDPAITNRGETPIEEYSSDIDCSILAERSLISNSHNHGHTPPTACTTSPSPPTTGKRHHVTDEESALDYGRLVSKRSQLTDQGLDSPMTDTILTAEQLSSKHGYQHI